MNDALKKEYFAKADRTDLSFDALKREGFVKMSNVRDLIHIQDNIRKYLHLLVEKNRYIKEKEFFEGEHKWRQLPDEILAKKKV